MKKGRFNWSPEEEAYGGKEEYQLAKKVFGDAVAEQQALDIKVGWNNCVDEVNKKINEIITPPKE